MKFVGLTIFILLINCGQFRADEVVEDENSPDVTLAVENLPKAILADENLPETVLADENLPKAKVFGVTLTNESIAVRFGDSVTLRDPIDKDETNEEWYLSRDDNVMTIYENGKLNPDIDRDAIQCLPSNDNCEALVIKNFTKKWIGKVLRQTKKDRLNVNFYQFLLTGYEAPLRIKCASDKMYACEYNATANTLYLREDRAVIIDCSALLWKYSDYDSPVEIHVKDCEDEPDIKTLQGTREGFKLFEITSRCKKSFSKTDSSFSCIMKYANIERSNSFILDQIDVKLAIEFGPIGDVHDEKDLKKTIGIGKGLSLKCPISGHPIRYFWKEIKNDKMVGEEIIGEKHFHIPKNLAAGVYNYECRAEINNAGSTRSDSIKFEVTVVGLAQPKKNLGILIGSIVGGVVGLVLIVLIIVFIVKKSSRKNRRKGELANDEEDVKFRK